jgi:hypothetical protein
MADNQPCGCIDLDHCPIIRAHYFKILFFRFSHFKPELYALSTGFYTALAVDIRAFSLLGTIVLIAPCPKLLADRLSVTEGNKMVSSD